MNPADVAQSTLPLASSDVSLIALFWQAHWVVECVMLGLLSCSVWVWAIAIDKILLLGQFGGQHELSDPVGGWRWRFRRSRDDITRCLDGFLHMAPRPTG